MRRDPRKGVRILAVVFALVPVLSLSVSAQWSAASAGVGVDANLRGVSISHSAAGKYTVWASGTKGTVLRSSDEGKSWEQLKIAGADDLDFRDIEGFGAHSCMRNVEWRRREVAHL